jgi:hypothetical protein
MKWFHYVQVFRHILMMIMHEPIGVPIFTSSGSYEFEKTEKYIVINLLWPFKFNALIFNYVSPLEIVMLLSSSFLTWCIKHT